MHGRDPVTGIPFGRGSFPGWSSVMAADVVLAATCGRHGFCETGSGSKDAKTPFVGVVFAVVGQH